MPGISDGPELGPAFRKLPGVFVGPLVGMPDGVKLGVELGPALGDGVGLLSVHRLVSTWNSH